MQPALHSIVWTEHRAELGRTGPVSTRYPFQPTLTLDRGADSTKGPPPKLPLPVAAGCPLF